MVGVIIVWIAFAAALVSVYGYFRSATAGNQHLALARNSFAVMAFAVMAASVMLLVYILRHQFEYAYVWGYSSRSLPLELLITTFWAGQEGSFLLWALCGSIIGLVLMSYTSRKELEPETMAIYAVVQSFLLLLLIVKSPFQYLWDAHPGEVPVGNIPSDGRGLNPLLQNFWMIAHPPVLFVGFAAMAVPFVFAMAALWRKTYTEWIHSALPWVIVGTIALGTGIMLGGYWAYGVLGWGGWWGWDPVENSSLIPWMIGIILIHTMLVQKRTGGMARTNFFLGICTYVLVVYSTFLTRSGILGSSSVHSFVDPGALAYSLLVVWIVGSLLIGFGMLVRRWGDLKAFAVHGHLFTRESFLGISSAVMGASALVILFGTSWPIISNASLEPSFYDKTNLPIAIAMGLLLGLSLVVQWREESRDMILKNSAVSLAASAVVVAILIGVGLNDVLIGLLAFASFFAFFINAIRMFKLAKQGFRYTGGTISHIGLALLFLGIIGSGRYGEKKTASLPLNEPKDVIGHQLTYTGSKARPDGKWTFSVKVEKGGSQYTLDPVMYQSDYNNSLMRNPDYAAFLTQDFYIEPVSMEEFTPSVPGGSGSLLEIRKEETKAIGDMEVTFLRFSADHKGMESMMGGDGLPIGAVLKIKRGTKTEEITPVTLYRGADAVETKMAKTKDGAVGFELLRMNVGNKQIPSTIQIKVSGVGIPAAEAPKSELLVIEASLKPFMSVVWAGAFFVILGLAVSLSTKFNGRSA